MREIERLFDLPPCGFETGIEREIVFMAKDRSGEVYNFNISPEVHEYINSPDFKSDELRELYRQGWIVEKEYSKALIEIVSPPKKERQLSELTTGVVYIRGLIDQLVPRLVEDRHPHLSDFTFFTQSRGISSTNRYLTSEGSIISDQESILDNVLKTAVDFVKHLEGFEMQIAGYTEANIGIYNHLSSTHVTFHPEYTKDKTTNSDKYFRLLMKLNSIILLFKPFDHGNRRILREGKIYEADENIRDLFLIELNRYLYDDFIDREYNAQATSVEAEIDNLEEYVEKLRAFQGEVNTNLDALFRNWNSLNFRPRFINSKLPVIEIRAFGSSISLAKIQQLVQLLAIFDRNY